MVSGPVRELNPADYDLVPSAGGFLAEEEATANEIEAAAVELGAVMEGAGELVDPDLGADEEELLPGVAGELALMSETDVEPAQADIDAAAEEVDGQVVSATETTPGEAWTAAPEAYTPPQPAVGDWDFGGGQVPPGGVEWPGGPGEPGGPGGPGVPGGYAGLTATIANVTRPGSAAFYVGDVYLLRVTGPSNQPVWVWGRHNDWEFGRTDVGMTDPYGVFTLSAQLGEIERGVWQEHWVVGYDQVEPAMEFYVL